MCGWVIRVVAIAMTTPIPPERFDAWRAAVAEMAGPRRAEFTAARLRQVRQVLLDTFGLDLTQPTGPPPEQVLDWSA